MTFDTRKITELNFNLEKDNLYRINSTSEKEEIIENTISQNNRRRLSSYLIGKSNVNIDSTKKSLKRCFTSKIKNNKNFIINETNSEMENSKSQISFTNVDKNIKIKNIYNNDCDISSDNSHIVNNPCNYDITKKNPIYEISSCEETVIINDNSIDRNLNSLKNEQKTIFMDIHKCKSSQNEIHKSIELIPIKLPFSKRLATDTIRDKHMNSVLSQNASFFESNLEVNLSNYNNHTYNFKNKNENETNSIYIVTDEKIPSNNDIKIDYIELNTSYKKINDKENITLLKRLEMSNRDSKFRELQNSERSSKSRLERSNGINDSDIENTVLIERIKEVENSDISIKFQIRSSRSINDSDLVNKSQSENNFKVQDKVKIVQLKDNLEFIKSDILNDGNLMIFNEKNNTHNLYVFLNNNKKFSCYSLYNNNISKFENNHYKENLLLAPEASMRSSVAFQILM